MDDGRKIMSNKKTYPAANGLPEFTLTRRKNMRRVTFTVNGEGELVVSAPPAVPLEAIREMIKARIDWVNKAVKLRTQNAEKRPEMCDGGSVMIAGQIYTLRVRRSQSQRATCAFSGGEVIAALPQPDDEELLKALLEKFLQKQAERLFEESLQRMYPLIKPLGAPMPSKLKVRKMTSRWGSCNTQTHVITMNLYLARAPLPLIDSVMLHELVHLVNFPHDARFHAISASLMPDYLERKKKLNSLDIIY